jgi:hypothetical protein
MAKRKVPSISKTSPKRTKRALLESSKEVEERKQGEVPVARAGKPEHQDDTNRSAASGDAEHSRDASSVALDPKRDPFLHLVEIDTVSCTCNYGTDYLEHDDILYVSHITVSMIKSVLRNALKVDRGILEDEDVSEGMQADDDGFDDGEVSPEIARSLEISRREWIMRDNVPTDRCWEDKNMLRRMSFSD